MGIPLSIEIDNINTSKNEVEVFLSKEGKEELHKRGFLVLKITNTLDNFLHIILLLSGVIYIVIPFIIYYLYSLITLFTGNAEIGSVLLINNLETNIVYFYNGIIPVILLGFLATFHVIKKYFSLSYLYISDYAVPQYIIGSEIENEKQIGLLRLGSGKSFIGKIQLGVKEYFIILMSIISIIYLALLMMPRLFLILLFLSFIFSIIFSIIVGNNNKFYLYGTIGQKIQSLTPRISEQSEKIQREFSSDMDFRVLSKSFDSLAHTFSDIVSLVIRLEKVEKKVNQGDLFDSAKYIDSLREDIRVPLGALRGFLDTQRTSLKASLDELSRVRVQVGGDNVLEGGKELQSMRGSELMQELDENIVRLDEMMERV